MLEPLGVIDGVEFAIGRTKEPWTLPIDVLTISADRLSGVGTLGDAVRAVMPGLAWDSLDFPALEPNAPQELPVAEADRRRAGSQVRSLAVTTVRQPGAERGFQGPATLATASEATAGVIRLAERSGLAALGLPLLGSETAGLGVDDVADVVVPEAVARATAPEVTKLRRIVFVCRDGVAERAIRLVWGLRVAVERPMPIRPATEELLGLTFAVMQARNESRASALDVVLAALVIAGQSRTRGSGPGERSATAALLEALPDDPEARIGRALAAVQVEARRLDEAPMAASAQPGLADVVLAGERIARRVGSSRVAPHHVAAAAVALLPEPEIPRPVLAALGVSQQQLRDALRDAVEERWPGESAEDWAEVWAAGERAPAGQRYADVLSDAESAEDRLGVTADVHAVAALLAATTSPPPLSVALLGNWGSGKSTFMNLVHQRVAALSEHAAGDPTSRFSPVIRQVRFNAWHYSDDHVWVGLIEHLFRALREVDQPAPASDGEVTRLEDELKAAQNRKARLDDELERIDELEPDRGWWGWLWQPRRLVLIMRAARRQAAHGLTWRSVLTGGLWALAIGVVIAGAVLGSPVIAWLAALPVVAALVTPAVSMWRRAREIAAAAHEKLVEDRKQLAADIAALEGKLARADPVRGLKALVDELNSGDRYKPFRGLTGQIHQDLARLDGQLGKLADPRQRQRIILYVDDLDRCTSDRVVHVLQAVNLLLSMPLFVVVVAVDPRWLLNALEEHYGKPLDGRARALDYLDKIFHVPFAVRPMSHRAGDYLRSLLPEVEPAEPVAAVATRAPDDDGPTRSLGPRLTSIVVPDGRSTRPAAIGPSVAAHQQLRIRQVEAEFLPRVAALLDTPRAVKKAVNLYVLLRATIPDAELDAFLGDEHGGPFQAAALLIAGVVSCPAEASDLLERVMLAKPDEPIGPVLRTDATPVCARLAGAIDGLGAEFPLLGQVSAYQPWARTVARYSFESYALFGVEPNQRPR